MRIRPLAATIVVLSSVLGSCGSDTDQGLSQKSPQSPAQPNDSSATATKEVRAAYIASVQQNADDSYAAVAGDGSLSFANDVHAIVATVDREGVIVAPQRDTWHLALRTVATGCEGAQTRVSNAFPEAAGNRVRYAREGLEEWYLNGPLGIEQGYVLREAAACSGLKTITMAVDGDVVLQLDDPDGDGRGESARVLNDEGRRVLAYGELFVKDASGKTLPAWLSVGAGELSIVVDDVGAKYPITIDPLVVTERAKLVAPDGAAGDRFGRSVSVDGDTAVAGAFYGDAKGADSGAVYVFRRNGTTWALEAKLTGSDTAAGDWFGHGVAVSGDTLVIGAPADDDKGTDSGSAYVFVRNNGLWTQQAKLVPSDGSTGDWAGISVAISGDTVIVGANYDDDNGNNSGSAYIFARNGTTWTQQAKLTSGEWGSGDEFGWTVSIDGNTALAAAPWGGPADIGAGYVFVRNGTTWTKQTRLLPSDGAAGDTFGCGATVVGDTILLGSFYARVGPNAAQGATYVYKRNGTTWTQEAKLVSAGGYAGEHFGYTVSLSGDLALIGAGTGNPKGSWSGIAYVFARNGSAWTQMASLTASDGSAGDQFGYVVSLSGSSAIIGALYDDINGRNDQGSAYIFDISLIPAGPPANVGSPCSTAADCATAFCVDNVCCDSPCTDTCMACAAAKKGSGVNGVCGSIAYDTDPDNECAGGSCDGKNVCKYYNGVACTLATQCLSNYCVDGYCCGNICMGECVACSTAKKGIGDNGVCGFIAPTTNPDAECSGGTCNGSGSCTTIQTKAANGAACISAAQCTSGYCADGVCCDSWCLGTCQACTAAKKGGGTDGTCGPLANGTDPENECFGGSCDGQGSCKRTNGTVCSTAGQCSSGYCVDNVCCDSVCNGACQACSVDKKGSGQNGVCASIDSGKDPDNECDPGECNGSGACIQPQTPLPTGTACITAGQCASGFCVDGFCCDIACNGTCQACSAAKKGNGSDGLCGNIRYDTDPDEECWGGGCSGDGACKFYNGLPCTTVGQCLSAYCVDGVCCDNVCTGTCSACSAAKKGGGFDGACGFITLGNDPDDECPAQHCSGSGTCTSDLLPLGSACPTAVQCASGFCVDGVCCDNACIGTCAACTAAKKGSGSDGVCGFIADQSDPDDECTNAYCNGSGVCTAPLLPLGNACTAASQCVSGFCADGVCCESACEGTCLACTSAKKGSGSNGVCGSIVATTDPDNECVWSECGGAGICQMTRLPLGSMCSSAAQCATGFCTDGRCCESACAGTCEACSAGDKGRGLDGYCEPVRAGNDWSNECPNGDCNGAGSCAALPLVHGSACGSSAACASGSCMDGICGDSACTATCGGSTAVPLGNYGLAGSCGRIAATNALSLTTGDTGGGPLTDLCPAGEVVIGFETNYSAGYYNNTFGQFVTLCGAVRIESTGANAWTARVTPRSRIPFVGGRSPFGTYERKEYSMCPPDQFVIGVQGEGNSFTRPVKMALRCAPMSVVQSSPGCFEFGRGVITVMPMLGKVSGTPYGPLDCPAGTVAWGSNLRTGEILNAYGLYCKSLSLVLGSN